MSLTRTALADRMIEIEAASRKPKSKGKGKAPAKRSLRAQLSTALRKALRGTKLEVIPQNGRLVIQHKSIEGPFSLGIAFKDGKEAIESPVWEVLDESHAGPRGSASPAAVGMLRPLKSLLARVNPKGPLELIPEMSTVAGMLTKALEAQQGHDRAGRRATKKS